MSKFTEKIKATLEFWESDADVDMVESCMRCETPDLDTLDEVSFIFAVKQAINNIRMDGTGLATHCLERRKKERREKDRRGDNGTDNKK